ncbi:MAG: fumarylacetoacetase [Actinomycetes bacterium]
MPALPVPDGSPFPLTNLPYAVGGPAGDAPHVLVAVGEQALDLARLARTGLLSPTHRPAATDTSLAGLFALGRPGWEALRDRLSELVTAADATSRLAPALVPLDRLNLGRPFEVADYVDFYSSIHHATNVGRLFRPQGEPLAPNWRWLPVGYHGRAGTVVVSNAPIVRPRGQRRPAAPDQPPHVGPTAQLDVEVEVGFVVGTPSPLGSVVPTSGFRDYVFGVVLVNDWSARDIQSWESAPLGPFLGKSFATTMSPWVVPLAALDSAHVRPPQQDPVVPDYLRCTEDWGLDIALELEINGTVVSRPPFASMYWTMPQQLAHATVNGAALRSGDLFASGTVSGPEPSQLGCLLELTSGGRDVIELTDGSTRTFLEDGDRVVIRGTAPGADGTAIGFGDCAGVVLPAD